jgi:threonyl-tRNA synthetase
LVDLSFVLTKDATVAPIAVSSKEVSPSCGTAFLMSWHSGQDVFNGAKVTIGPSIEDGFYYDFEYAEPLR